MTTVALAEAEFSGNGEGGRADLVESAVVDRSGDDAEPARDMAVSSESEAHGCGEDEPVTSRVPL